MKDNDWRKPEHPSELERGHRGRQKRIWELFYPNLTSENCSLEYFWSRAEARKRKAAWDEKYPASPAWLTKIEVK